MKVKIDGRTYDTAKAEKIATHDNGLPRMDLDYIREALYRQDGVLFLAGESGARGRYAKNEETGGKIGGEGGYILSLEEAKEWIELTQGYNAALSLERQAALFTWLEKAENEELTASDAARVLGVDRQTLIRRIERGELKARKDGRFWRIKRRDIEPKEEG